jgi:hypothetical protein
MRPGILLTIDVWRSPTQLFEHCSRVVPGLRWSTKITLAIFCLRSDGFARDWSVSSDGTPGRGGVDEVTMRYC